MTPSEEAPMTQQRSTTHLRPVALAMDEFVAQRSFDHPDMGLFVAPLV